MARTGNYYVYHHVDQGGNVFYVGMAAKETRRDEIYHRSPEWAVHVHGLGESGFTSKVVGYFDTKEEALQFETREIQRLNPVINKSGFGRKSKVRMLSSITASEMGKLGALKTNKILTPEGRSIAAKKGWKKRKQAAKSK